MGLAEIAELVLREAGGGPLHYRLIGELLERIGFEEWRYETLR